MSKFFTILQWFLPILLLVLFIYLYLLNNIISFDNNIIGFYSSLLVALITNIIIFFIIDFENITLTISIVLNIFIIILIYYIINSKIYSFDKILHNIPFINKIIKPEYYNEEYNIKKDNKNIITNYLKL